MSTKFPSPCGLGAQWLHLLSAASSAQSSEAPSTYFRLPLFVSEVQSLRSAMRVCCSCGWLSVSKLLVACRRLPEGLPTAVVELWEPYASSSRMASGLTSPVIGLEYRHLWLLAYAASAEVVGVNTLLPSVAGAALASHTVFHEPE